MQRSVTVFGGTGFLGRRVVHHLLEDGFAVRVAARHPSRARLANEARPVEALRADVDDDGSVAAAVAGAFAVVNAVSLYVEGGGRTFHSVHVEAAARVARHARDAGVARLVQVSGIGADAGSASRYIKSRGQGEEAVRAAFPAATVIRPAVMFGPDDAFLTPLVNMLRQFPAFPLFGRGGTRVQPAHVDDVAAGVARALALEQPEPLYELAGPRVYTYENLLRTICAHLGVERMLVPLPFGLWRPLAFAAEMLPHPPLTVSQIELMEIDTIAGNGPGFAALGIAPRSVESELQATTSDP